MKVMHVITSLSRSAGGPARSVQGLVAGLGSAGLEVWLLALRHGEHPWVAGIDHFVNAKPFENALQEIKPDVVHLHGVWILDIHQCAVICQRRKIPYVIAPRGMLEPWSLKQKWIKKRIARFLYQDRDLKSAAALHATAGSEAEQFRKLGFTNDCIISPNGVNVPEQMPARGVSDGRRRALFVSRMHAKKGVLELVESWARVKPAGWICELVYTLNGEDEKAYEAQIKARVKELGIADAFIFTGALDDGKKWGAYARADLFVLPTYSENFGIVVAEALWAGVPVITTKGTPWQDLESSNAGWWIDLPPKESLDAALREATGRSEDELRALGQNGHRLVVEKYSWDAACKAMIAGYERILKGVR